MATGTEGRAQVGRPRESRQAPSRRPRHREGQGSLPRATTLLGHAQGLPSWFSLRERERERE